MFDYRMWLAPYLAIIFLVFCCLVTTCFAQMYSNKDTEKGGEIELKASERKKIRKRNRKSSPYGSTVNTNTTHNLCTSETQTSLPYYAENFAEKTADGTDHQCNEVDDTLNENQLKEGDRSTQTEEATQDDTYDNDNEISLNLKKSELEKENSEHSDVMEVIDSKEKYNSSTDAVIQTRAIYSENAKNKNELEKEKENKNKNIKNSEMTEVNSSKIGVNSSRDGAVCVD